MNELANPYIPLKNIPTRRNVVSSFLGIKVIKANPVVARVIIIYPKITEFFLPILRKFSATTGDMKI